MDFRYIKQEFPEDESLNSQTSFLLKHYTKFVSKRAKIGKALYNVIRIQRLLKTQCDKSIHKRLLFELINLVLVNPVGCTYLKSKKKAFYFEKIKI